MRQPRKPREKRPGNSSYLALLRDPRWQKRRLEIFEAAGWECRYCGGKDKTLHVHHRYYERGKLPWEYPDDALTCLCETCHELVTAQMEAFKQASRQLLDGDHIQARGYLEAMVALQDCTDLTIDDYQQAIGIGDAMGVDADLVIGTAGASRILKYEAISRWEHEKVDRDNAARRARGEIK